jgi:hypothetical protein
MTRRTYPFLCIVFTHRLSRKKGSEKEWLMILSGDTGERRGTKKTLCDNRDIKSEKISFIFVLIFT